jgi:hypothetical protein
MVVLMMQLLWLAPVVVAGELGRAGEQPQIIAFDGNDFTGDHTHFVGDMRRLGKWDNSISSIIILSGTWEFFDDEDLMGTKIAMLGPGQFRGSPTRASRITASRRFGWSARRPERPRDAARAE